MVYLKKYYELFLQFKAIDEKRIEIKQLRTDVSKGKGAINLLIILGGLAGVLLGFFKWDG